LLNGQRINRLKHVVNPDKEASANVDVTNP
jgi:hypothetical protein